MKPTKCQALYLRVLTIYTRLTADHMETIQDYCHFETRVGRFDSKELPTYIPLMSHVQTLRKNDTEQDSTCHRTTPNQGTCRFQIREIMHK